MKNLFTDHPHSVDETYWQHLKFAVSCGLTMVIGGLACVIHGLLPFIFKKTGSNFLLKLTRTQVERMPVVDHRVMALSKLIEKQIAVTSQTTN